VSYSPTEGATLVDVTMPQMGVSVAEGTVIEWRKQVGDWVQRDEIICAISTDKIDTDVESPATGRLGEIVVQVGETVDVGTVLARIATDARPGEPHRSENSHRGDGPSAGATEAATGTGEATAALEAPGAAGELQGDTTEAVNEGSAQAAAGRRGAGGARRYSPVVLRIAAEHGIDLERVEGTGRGGRVRKQDVLALVGDGGAAAPEAVPEPPMHIESPYRPDVPVPPRPRTPRFGAPEPAAAAEAAPVPPTPADAGPAHSAPLSRMRQSIGRHMLQSLQTAATCTTVIEADMTRIAAARTRSGLTWLPYVARATVETLRDLPALNATLDGETLTHYDAVHLGIAVSLGEDGLIVPVIRDAQDLSVEGLAQRVRELARRARSGGLSADDVRGGTFTITNPGGYGSIIATPVINQPQVAILDTEAVVKRPVVVTDELGNDSIAIRHMTYLCMSWDHRALDGALAAQFLAALRDRLERWPLD
jgi:pyruvate/2-oxoglutarate dehydrogenase complex dihydrolipoamide acyltransferase (E2) component